MRYRTPDRRQTDKRGFRTKREAEMFAATVEVAKARGQYVAPSMGRVTVGELADDWLAPQAACMRRFAPQDAGVGLALPRRFSAGRR